MKKTIWSFGIIAGLILAFGIFLSGIFQSHFTMENSMYFGYTLMLLAFSLIFVGVKQFRDKHNGGAIGFGKAFKIGFFICLIGSSMYVLSWLIDYYYFIPDFADKYAAHTLEKLKASGVTEAVLKTETAKMESFKTMYKNPLFNILITYSEILPLGTALSLISALILKRKSVN